MPGARSRSSAKQPRRASTKGERTVQVRTQSRASELLGLIAFAAAAVMAISLLSFDPFDPSYFTHVSPARSTTTNLAGSVGANVSYGLLETLGVFAYGVPVLLIVGGVRRLRGAAAHLGIGRLMATVTLWLSVSALLSITVGTIGYLGSAAVHVKPIPIPAGGQIGQLLAIPVARWLGPAGSLIVLLTALTGSVILSTPPALVAWCDRTLRSIGSVLIDGPTRMLTAIRNSLQELRDERAARRQQRALDRDQAALEREQREHELAELRARQLAERQQQETRRLDDELAPAPDLQVDPEREHILAARGRAIEDAARTAAARVRQVSQLTSAATPRLEQLEPPPFSVPTPGHAEEVVRGSLHTTVMTEPSARTHDEPPAEPSTTTPAHIESPQPARPSVTRATSPTTIATPAPVEPTPASPRTTDDVSVANGAPTPAIDAVHEMAARAAESIKRARAEPTISRRVPAPRDRDAPFDLPPIDLLDEVSNDGVITEQELVENAQVLVSKLSEFSVEGTVQAIHPGPVVTTYEYRPEPGVKYSKIVGLADDLCLAMAAEGVRIDRISGKSAVGIEVPNSIRETIGLRELLESEEFSQSTSKLAMSIGKDISGEPFFTDLRKMPHLLVAGATGAGKSVAINCMIVSILYKSTPADVRFIMVDPKRIELGIYDGIPHLLVPVVTDARKASNALRWGVTEMENRYKKLASLGVRSLEQYNSIMRGPKAKTLAKDFPPEDLVPLPYIVILIDELADLMMVAASDVEDSISRLAAMARAVGIHLVLATQRPSVDVITGVIKANFPSRISFRVSSKVDSRTILDSNGAEMLLGKGDGLFMPPGSARLVRLHGGFISDEEVQRLVAYLKNQAEPSYDETVLAAPEERRDDVAGAGDEMYEEAVRVVLETGQASVSMLQRRLRLGYGRAARMVDMMELNGIVGPSQGAKGREILVDRQSYLSEMAAVS